MEEPRIVVEVTPEGQVRLDAQSFRGRACLQATDQLVARLGQLGLSLGVEARADKPELAVETEVAGHQVIGQRQAATQ